MPSLSLEMTFDFICPWCLIGKRNLDAALRLLARQRPELDVRVNWLGLQLLPQVPMQGEPFAEFYQRRLGGKRAVRARQAEVYDAARRAGVEIELERIQTMPNTTYAHRVFQRAAQVGSQAQLERLLELLFRAHFQLGEDIGQRETLKRLLRSCDYLPEQFDEALADGARAFIGRRVGLADSSVPLFLADGRAFALGGQSPEQLLASLLRTLDRQEALSA
ncbi:DsbA family protein [Pseudomonas sp. ZM23]|uniref:DsbA family protein n=1 Tax=Pseudomonas triclosanedens TaxID=2961893 RepID=A0ABY6ZQZ5_9PSED|nr:DsbA family protein [Pseudomonas triclosanedens]MCP8466162.1 DsbA family protein [Pseudomonas triclosanedens]MCP8472397.1 DsbA family protein [Pseudomonas triclosanedens]MCP8477461.1 DsbA family protein [Pseudomonas triclosanedens]WAI47206.1 DsbA family protein [Pseudomonas triclosanedens]